MRGSGTPRHSKSEAGPSRPIRPLQGKIDAMTEQALVQPDACCVHWRPSLIPARTMPLLSSPRRDELRGDFLRRRARFGLLLLAGAMLVAVPVFGGLDRLWPTIAALEGIPFLAAATLLGGTMAACPVLDRKSVV